MFLIPQAYKCPDCAHTTYSQGAPFCPECYRKFIAKHVPVMVPDPEAKPYNPNDQTVYC